MLINYQEQRWTIQLDRYINLEEKESLIASPFCRILKSWIDNSQMITVWKYAQGQFGEISTFTIMYQYFLAIVLL